MTSFELLSNLESKVLPSSWGAALLNWTEPGWWWTVSATLFVLIWIHPYPLSLQQADKANREEKVGLVEITTVFARQFLLFFLVSLVLIYPITLFALTKANLSVFTAWWSSMAGTYWTLPVAGFTGGIAAGFFWEREVLARWKKWSTQNRKLVETDNPSDIRLEAGKLKARDFNPATFYRPSNFFLGLNAELKPYYLSGKTFAETHMQIVGPTRFGKGVLLGGLLDQAIRHGHGVVYLDPKNDKFLPYIMKKAADAAGRKFVFLDLNSDMTKWAPFEGGNERDRRSRIISAFQLGDAGSDADFYKATERVVVDEILPLTGGSVRGMLSALEKKVSGTPDPLKDQAKRLFDGLSEFSMLPALIPKKGGGIKISEALLEGAAVYVRGSLDDVTVKKASRLFITEVIQEARRLAPQRQHHLTLAVDELKFMISQEISDALATAAGFNVNMILLHQSLMDLRAPEDKSLDAKALESGVLVNCQVKVLYRASDPETARWASEMSGTRQIRVEASSKTRMSRYGVESYTGDRTFNYQEEALLTQNQFLSMAPRVGAVFVPEKTASILYTCFVQADTSLELLRVPVTPAAAPKMETPPLETTKAEAPKTEAPKAKLETAAPSLEAQTAEISLSETEAVEVSQADTELPAATNPTTPVNARQAFLKARARNV